MWHCSRSSRADRYILRLALQGFLAIFPPGVSDPHLCPELALWFNNSHLTDSHEHFEVFSKFSQWHHDFLFCLLEFKNCSNSVNTVHNSSNNHIGDLDKSPEEDVSGTGIWQFYQSHLPLCLFVIFLPSVGHISHGGRGLNPLLLNTQPANESRPEFRKEHRKSSLVPC